MEPTKTQSALPEMMRGVIVPINRDGWLFIGIFAAVALLLGLASCWLGLVGWIATAWCVYFFRDPARVTPTREGLIISPADGRVSAVVKVKPPVELGMGDGERVRVSIFLNVFDVHVNRVPAAGVITGLHYHHGKFLNASLDKASEDNERQLVKMRMNDGREIAFVQIAGLVARRIICQLMMSQQVVSGERFGHIRFGSRTDVYLPEGVESLAIVGQRAVGGETVIADCAGAERAREGVLS